MIRMSRTMMLILAAACVALAGSAMADSFLKQVVHIDAFEMAGQKQPEKNDTTIMWLTEGNVCLQIGNVSAVIFDAEKGVMYMVDHEKKEYLVVPMDLFDGGSEEGASESDEMAKMMQAMMGETEVTVTKTDETKKIGDWNCTKYDVEISMAMMTTKQELWATEDIKIDYTMFNAVNGGMMAQMPGFDKIVEEMKQIEGVAVMTIVRVSMMGQEITTTTELIEYAEKDAPEGVFDIPEGYKKVQMGMGMGKD